MSDHSVSQWIDDLKAGDERAADRIWQRYFEKLTRLARGRLNAAARRASDEEDAALSALNSFYRGVAQNRFPRLSDRDDLWKLLLTITERKAIAQAKMAHRQKRGGGLVRGDSLFFRPDSSAGAGFGEAAEDPEPTPEFAAEFAEQLQRLMEQLQDDTLEQVATRKMEGYTNQEIADHLGCSERSVKRKLQVIRTVWSKELS